ncbi:MAG: NAD-dependent epimerase/dehydratase family protein [Nitrospiraceae bacterium]
MATWSQKAVLVVGGAGFVGSNLVRRVLQDGAARVVVVDNLLSAERDNLPSDPAVTFIEGSIADDVILSQLPDVFDYVFHLATYHGNQSSIADPLADHANNTLTSLKLFEKLKSYKRLSKVVYASAGCTVAEKTFADAKATTEEAPVSLYLDSPYQISKIIGELYANYYYKQYGLPVVKARFQNVYGPGEVLGAGRWRGTPATVWRNVTPSFVFRAIRRLPLIVENGGIATRDFIYVDDIVEGLMRCALAGAPGEVFNLASGVETSIGDLAKLINELTDNPVPVELGPTRNWDHSGKRYGSIEKAHTQLGFVAKEPLRTGIQHTIEWTQRNLPWIEACIRKHQSQMPELTI